MPQYVKYLETTYKGKVSWEHGKYTYSCGADGFGFLRGVHWYYETADAHASCAGEMHSLDESPKLLQTLNCSDSDVFQQWEFLRKQPEDKPEVAGTDFITLSSCEESLAINQSLNTSEAVELLLEINGSQFLNAQQKQAYQYVDNYEVVIPQGRGTTVLFACQAAQSGGGKLCASRASVSPNDLATAYVSHATLTIQKVCPVLLNSSVMNSSIGRPLEPNGMTVKAFSDAMLNVPYKTVPFDTATGWPFFYKGSEAQRAQSVGFLSIPANGDSFWGVTCPAGAVVVSEEKTMPHCLDIDASVSQEVFTSYSGSATCPPGTALSGWYNLPGISVRGNTSAGGPKNWTGLQIMCRRTALIGFCEQPSKPHCTVGHVVNAISYSQNQFKLGCCRFLRPMGASLTGFGRAQNPYLGFEGYYCPTAMGSTGAALYAKTAIRALGEPGTSSDLNYTLVWDKFKGDWCLRNGNELRYAIHSSALSPVEIAGDPISATPIKPLVSESQPKVQSPFPAKKPTYPKLLQFHPVQPNYAAYCNPEFLESPASFRGQVAETNPCYHTFNADMVQGFSETKGISESAFWACSQRSKARDYLKGMVQYSQNKAASALQAEKAKLAKIQLWLELAAAVAGAVPLGSWGLAGSKGSDKAEYMGEETAEKQIQEKAEEEAKKAILAKLDKIKGGLGVISTSLGLSDKVVQIISAYKTGHVSWSRNLRKQHVQEGAITNKTVPKFEGGVAWTKEMAEAAWTDCLPLQYGLSKVMCDLFCVQNSVRSGTSAVLESLQNSQAVLMKNLQALLNYQTQYILWALGTVLTPSPTTAEDATVPEEVPEASTLLSELQQIDFEHMKATVPRLSRDILHWHQATGQQLYDRLASLTVNASRQSWPLRVKAARGMLHHFQAHFQRQLLKRVQEPPMADKVRKLREDTSEQHQLGNKARDLKFDLGSKALTAPLVEAFLRCHEKHSTYVMLHSKALHQMDAALGAARNFTKCDADTKDLHQAWQLAIRADERSQEVLLEAWAATVAGAERIEIAMKDEQLLSLLGDWTKDVEVEVTCQNSTALVLQSHALAIGALDRAAWALTQEVITFQALAVYQEHQLNQKRLEHTALPDVWKMLKIQLAAAADPGQRLGQRLAAAALQSLGLEFCPAPPGCARGILVGADGADGAVPCEHGQGATSSVLPKRLASQLIEKMPLRTQPLRSLSLVQLVEVAGEEARHTGEDV